MHWFSLLILIFTMNVQATDKPYVLKKFERSPKTLGQVTNLSVKYSRERLLGNLHRFLAAGRPSRFFGSEGHKQTRAQILENLKDVQGQGEVTIESFSLDSARLIKQFEQDIELAKDDANVRNYAQGMLAAVKKVREISGQNIVWEKKGTTNPEEILILGAHYDTIAIDSKNMQVATDVAMPGADHNGTGVMAAMAVIEVLAQVDIPRTVRVIFFDAESIGKSGSQAYSLAHKAELNGMKPAGFISLLMLGHDTVHQDKTSKSGNMCMYTRDPGFDTQGAKIDLALANRLINAGKEVRSAVTFEPRAHADIASAHLAFQEIGLATVVMTHDWENDYNSAIHTKQDFAETLNFGTFYTSTQYLIGSVLAWAFDIR